MTDESTTSDQSTTSDESTGRLEYITVRPPRGETMKEAEDPESALNSHAAEGWQLVGTIDYTGGGTKFLVMARPVDDAADESEASS